ncbi:hypothetical protein OBBRIDRAFT_221080 [Obba rivulosa]|uniref:Uncharacterized protein n=1 Tax=Obba rivulosa TaxID=1052685 RepID=A0A8E2ANJ3_9APHY|nr:hypothetical protein OBBRIDRAFT_221080 [Obba rivulosa]
MRSLVTSSMQTGTDAVLSVTYIFMLQDSGASQNSWLLRPSVVSYPSNLRMKPALRRDRVNGGDVLAHAISALETLRDVSNVVGSVPLFGVVIGAALSLLGTIQKVKGDKERCGRLATRTLELLRQMERSLATSTDIIDDDLRGDLVSIQSTLVDIQGDLNRVTSKNAGVRFLRQASIAASLDQHANILENALRSFNIACLIALRQKISEQDVYGKYQLRLLRWCDLKLQRRHGIWHARSGISGDEMFGEWEGRAVTIRILRQENSIEDVMESSVSLTPHRPHPSVAQFLGYSHPSTRTKFYILERGPVDAIEYLKTGDPPMRLRTYLQMHVDYQETFKYLQSSCFPVAETGEVHSHASCLPSLSLREDGTLLLSAEDLVEASPDRLLYHLLDAVGFNTRNELPRKTMYPPSSADPRALLSATQSGSQDYITSELFKSRGVQVSSYSWSSQCLHAKIGDYGHIDPETTSFITLGNAFDLMPTRSPQWSALSYIDDVWKSQSLDRTSSALQ